MKKMKRPLSFEPAAETEQHLHLRRSPKKKKKKKAPVEEVMKPAARSEHDENQGEGKKSSCFQRSLWSEHDEIALLRGMLDFKEEKGADPMAHRSAFHDFLKESLHAQFETKQVGDKGHKLKRKYEKQLLNNKINLTPHDLTVFELSARIWAHNNNNNHTQNQNQKKARKTVSSSTAAPLPDSSYLQFCRKWGSACGWNEDFVNAGLALCTDDKKAEIVEKWKQISMDEANIFLRKLEALRQVTEVANEALKSSGMAG